MRCASVLLFLGAAAAAAQTDAVYRNPTAGFEITKPAGWHYLTADRNTDRVLSARLRDSQLQAAVIANTAHLIAITKFPEPHPDVNPAVTVMMGPIGGYRGRPPTELFKALLPLLGRGSPKAEITYAPAPVAFYGLNGVFGQLRYPVGGSWRLSDVYLVPRGDFFFVIASEMAWEDNPAVRADLGRIVASIKIQH